MFVILKLLFKQISSNLALCWPFQDKKTSIRAEGSLLKDVFQGYVLPWEFKVADARTVYRYCSLPSTDIHMTNVLTLMLHRHIDVCLAFFL